MTDAGGAAERAPLIDSDGNEEGSAADPNRLALVDWVWLLLHAGFAACDSLALYALLQRRFKGALFFGGHTQFLGNWSLCLSLTSHLLAIYATAAVEPTPNPYRFNIRRHDHREKTYYWQSMVLKLCHTPVLRVLTADAFPRVPFMRRRLQARSSFSPRSPCSVSPSCYSSGRTSLYVST